MFGDAVKSLEWAQSHPDEIIIGKKDRALIKDCFDHWTPYARFGDRYICMGWFVQPTEEERQKWLDGEEIELLT